MTRELILEYLRAYARFLMAVPGEIYLGVAVFFMALALMRFGTMLRATWAHMLMLEIEVKRLRKRDEIERIQEDFR